MNQRPLGRIPNDPDDGEYICPNDMLLGRASSKVPQGPVKETSNSRHRAEFVQRSVQVYKNGELAELPKFTSHETIKYTTSR